MGTGIKRITDAVHLGNLPSPKFDFSDSSFRVELRDMVDESSGENAPENAPEKQLFGQMQKWILEKIKENPRITYDELSVLLNKDRTTIMRNILKLKELELIRRIGPDKGGYWQVIKKFK